MKHAVLFGVLVAVFLFLVQPIRYNYDVPYVCSNPPLNTGVDIRLQLHSCPNGYITKHGQNLTRGYGHGPFYEYILKLNKSPSVIDKQQLVKNGLYSVLAGSITYAGVLRYIKHRSKK